MNLFSSSRWSARNSCEGLEMSALALIGASVCMASLAAQVTPPSAAGISAEQAVNAGPAVLAKLVGFHQFGTYSMVRAKLEGSQLSTPFTGQGFVPVYPGSKARSS